MNVRSNRTKHFSKRTKIIAICTIAVLILAGAGIALDINNNNNNTGSNVDSNEPDNNSVEFMPVNNGKERTNETSDVMPATGASSAAVLAIVAGSATTAASYYLVAKH